MVAYLKTTKSACVREKADENKPSTVANVSMTRNYLHTPQHIAVFEDANLSNALLLHFPPENDLFCCTIGNMNILVAVLQPWQIEN
jgi:hypothetical protein